MTWLVASIPVEELSSLADDTGRAFAAGADAVELRLDSFDGDPLAIFAFLRKHSECRWIVTYRSREEGGSFSGDTMERVSKLLAASRGTGAVVDFEWADWSRSDNIRQKVRMAAGGEDVGQADHAGRLILSSHDFRKRPNDNAKIAHAMIKIEGLAAAKIAYRAETIVDSFDALDLMHSLGDQIIAIAMGEDGLWTRVLAKKLGAFATFASVGADTVTAPGQLTLEQMKAYRFEAIGSRTKVFGVVGDPVRHSMSPFLFNRWFADSGIDAVYLPLRVRGGADGFELFLDECRKRSWLDLRGVSVTLPHKTAAYAYAGDGADGISQRIGAANTLAFAGGAVRAFNTDAQAGVDSIVSALGCSRSDLADKSVDVLGAGGAARAIISGLHELGCRLTIYARKSEQVEPLVASFGCLFQPWEKRCDRSGDIVINGTSLGFAARQDESPLPPTAFDGCRLAFDIIYNPLRTVFLDNAARSGVATLNGVDMFVRQAATQFEHWTGQPPDTTAGVRWVTEKIEAETEARRS